MAKVLIVSKTKMNERFCVGGIDMETGEFIRLHNERGGNLTAEEAPYEIGDVWELEVKTAWNVRNPPHVEDKQTIRKEKLEHIGVSGIIDYVQNHDLGDRLTEGALDGAFEGCLQSRNYVTGDTVPSFSTQFWVPDHNLTLEKYEEHIYYRYHGLKIKYVGLMPAIEEIPAGTFIRLSLANWWGGTDNKPFGEERCYLQISGWYLPQ